MPSPTNYIKWGFESRLKSCSLTNSTSFDYIKWGFESRLKFLFLLKLLPNHYIKWGFESRLKSKKGLIKSVDIISNGDLRVG